MLIINRGIFLVKYQIYPYGYTWNYDFMRKDSAELYPERQDLFSKTALQSKFQYGLEKEKSSRTLQIRKIIFTSQK